MQPNSQSEGSPVINSSLESRGRQVLEAGSHPRVKEHDDATFVKKTAAGLPAVSKPGAGIELLTSAAAGAAAGLLLGAVSKGSTRAVERALIGAVAGAVTQLTMSPRAAGPLSATRPARPRTLVSVESGGRRTPVFLRLRDPQRMQALAPELFRGLPIYFSRQFGEILTLEIDEARREQIEIVGDVDIIPSTTYAPVGVIADPVLDGIYSAALHDKTLHDVLDQINAPGAWTVSRGERTHIAIVDTGVSGAMTEFPSHKRSPYSWPSEGDDPWMDHRGHGSMTACIAAGTRSHGGRYDGVAPDASVIACRTTFNDVQLYQIYEYLLSLVEKGRIGRLVINNSFGLYVAAAPPRLPAYPFHDLVRRLVDRGVVVVFAAGNNHVQVAGHDPGSCDGNTIWGVNSLDEVICVGTVDERASMHSPSSNPNDYSHCDSSRGPGEFSKKTTKPDCVAPTYGEVVYGSTYRSLAWWGTSGAAPQVAGLAALILARHPNLTSAQVYEAITRTCTGTGLARTCSGHGLINCEAAVRYY